MPANEIIYVCVCPNIYPNICLLDPLRSPYCHENTPLQQPYVQIASQTIPIITQRALTRPRFQTHSHLHCRLN
jgi:hypothetical protein